MVYLSCSGYVSIFYAVYSCFVWLSFTLSRKLGCWNRLVIASRIQLSVCVHSFASTTSIQLQDQSRHRIGEYNFFLLRLSSTTCNLSRYKMLTVRWTWLENVSVIQSYDLFLFPFMTPTIVILQPQAWLADAKKNQRSTRSSTPTMPFKMVYTQSASDVSIAASYISSRWLAEGTTFPSRMSFGEP